MKDVIAMIALYGAPVLAITVNTSGLSNEEARQWCVRTSEELGIPAVLPFDDSVKTLVPVLEKLIVQSKNVT